LRGQGGMQKVDTTKGGAIAVTSEAYPQSIRLAFPGKDFQIEVISPSVSRVKQLETDGEMTSIWKSLPGNASRMLCGYASLVTAMAPPLVVSTFCIPPCPRS